MERALKHSKQREYLIELLESTKCHPDAHWLFFEMKKRFKNVSLATIYRNIRLLSETGLILKLDVGDGVEHYDITTEQHYHFVCQKCKKIEDIDMPALDWLDEKAAELTNKNVHRHSLIFYGICEKCL